VTSQLAVAQRDRERESASRLVPSRGDEIEHRLISDDQRRGAGDADDSNNRRARAAAEQCVCHVRDIPRVFAMVHEEHRQDR
jgi:hypothetical protein